MRPEDLDSMCYTKSSPQDNRDSSYQAIKKMLQVEEMKMFDQKHVETPTWLSPQSSREAVPDQTSRNRFKLKEVDNFSDSHSSQ